MNTFNKERGVLLDSDDTEGRSTAKKWGQPQETERTKNMDNQQLFKSQQDQMKDQDDALDVLGSTLGRIKEVGIMIGQEADEHNRLLDDINAGVDSTNSNVKNTTRRVERIERKSSTCCLWIYIIVLIVVLVVTGIAAIKT